MRDVTYDECMERLRAVEPLPVGERFSVFYAEWLDGDDDWPPCDKLWSRLLDESQCGAPSHKMMNVEVEQRARPLRIARERAKRKYRCHRDWLVATNENARLRAALDEALAWMRMTAIGSNDRANIARIRSIAEGRTK